MRTVFVSVTVFSIFATIVQAADNAPIAGQLPDDEESFQLYLFQLKKTGLSLRMSPEDFCTQMKYGKPVLAGHQENDEVGREDHKQIKGELDWVICRFQRKR
jgi:hypothetical protein